MLKIKFPFISSTLISLSAITVMLSCLFAGQMTYAQTPCTETVSTKPKAVEPIKQITKNYVLEILNKESVCINGVDTPISLTLRNNSLISYIKKVGGINFVLTPNIEEQLKNAGASTDLMTIIKRENSKISDQKLFLINLGMEASAQKDYDEAIANYTEVINLDPDNRVAYINRGGIYKILGDVLKKEKNYEEANKKYDEAIADFTQAIRVDPTNRSGYNNRGSSYYEKYTNNNIKEAFANMEKAIADFSRAIEVDPNFIDAYKNRAEAYQFMGKKEEAEADRQKIIELRKPKDL